MQLFKQCCYQSEKAHFGTHWRETTQVQLQLQLQLQVRLCFNLIKQSEAAQKDPLWRKASQMHNVRVFQHSIWAFESSHDEAANRRKTFKCITSTTTFVLLLVICRVTWLWKQTWNISGKTGCSSLHAVMWKEMQFRKYRWKYREISVIAAVCGTCKREAGQVANGRRDKTGSCRATNEVEWLTPTSEASSHVHYSKKHQVLVISIENFWVMWLQSFFPSSWGVPSPDPHRRVGRGTWLGGPLLGPLDF